MSNKNKRRSLIKPDLTRRYDNYLSILLLGLVGAVTFLLRATMINYTSPRLVAPALDTGWQTDIFSRWKLYFVIILAIFAVVIMGWKIIAARYEMRASYLNLPLLLLVILVLLSTLTADYKNIALWGIYNQGTGSLILLAYLALCLAAANTVFPSWFSRGLSLVLMVITAANAVILLTSFAGHDITRLPWVQTLLAPPDLQTNLSGKIKSTLGNVNYISGLAAALWAYFSAGVLLKQGWRQKTVYILAALVSFAMILASFSSSGFVTLVIVLPLIIAVAFLSPERRQTWLAGGITMALCLGVFMVMYAIDPMVSQNTTGFFKNGISDKLPPLQLPAWAESINTSSPMAYAADTHTNAVSQDAQLSVSPRTDFNLPKRGWAAGTGRVYNWKETWKLIEKRPLLGYGQGTLAYYFPQNDINKIAAMYSYDTLITKPHNMYLDVAFGSGIPALLAMLALFLRHFYLTGRRLWQARGSEGLFLPAALFLFFCAFAVQGLFNDTVIDAGAIFWVLLGISISLNLDLDQS